MRTSRAGTALLLALLLALPAGAAEAPLLLFPPDLALTAEGKVKVFAWNPSKGAADNVTVNGESVNPWEGESFPKGEIALQPGYALVRAFGKDIRLFLLPGVTLPAFEVPTGKEGETLLFRAYRLHPALDDGCESCHVSEGGKLSAKDQKEACYACHNDFSKSEDGKKVFVHAPVGSGECTGCHDPHFSARPKLQKLEKGCLECHDAFPSGGTVHWPVAKNDCISCHSPHAGPAPKQLVRPGNALCLGCHPVPHPFERHRSPGTRGAMTQVPEDFPRDKDELSCLGCHVPHQSAEEKLFTRKKKDLCAACHRL